MNMPSMKEDLKLSVVDLRFQEIEGLVERALKSGLGPLEVLEELRAGLKTVGDRYQAGEYFLSELYMAAETMNNALGVLRPHISAMEGGGPVGTIVVGSIEGDIHDFGKTIVSSLLTAAGLNVVDLGVDVPAEAFVAEAEKVGADVIGVSALLSTTQPAVKKIVEKLGERGLRGKYKVILGGSGVDTEKAIEEFGVDAAVNDGARGVDVIISWMEERGD